MVPLLVVLSAFLQEKGCCCCEESAFQHVVASVSGFLHEHWIQVLLAVFFIWLLLRGRSGSNEDAP